MEPHEKFDFVFALVAAPNVAEFYKSAARARQVYQNGYRLVPPPKPTLQYTAQDGAVEITWSNDIEFAGSNVLEYRVYKTTDPNREVWGAPVAVIPRDTTRLGVVPNAYSWRDTAGVQNFFYYSYSVTVLDADSLESGMAFLPADQSAFQNTVEARPLNAARTLVRDVRVVPNPYVISASWERKRLGDPKLGEPIRDIAFTNLPSACTIRIYTLDGNLVKTIEHTSGRGTEFWDLRSSSNQLIATGVYFYHVTATSGEHLGRFAVVR
jgi:hypothetical protein